MEKTNENYRSEIAKIIAVELDESLRAANELHERMDIRLRFKFNSDAKDEDFSEIDEELLELAKKASRKDEYTYLLDTLRLGEVMEDYDEDTQNGIFKKYKKKFEGKAMYFTLYRFSIASLLKGTPYEFALDGDELKPVSYVHNDIRVYPSFNSVYILKHDDINAVYESMRNNLLNDLAEGKYLAGRDNEETKRITEYRKNLRKAANE